MYLFYCPDIEIKQTLSEEESGHCVRVLRYSVGDEILITDGKGTTYTARITNPHPKHCDFEILSREKQEKHHRFHLHIAIAPTKNIERLEWAIEKCVEIGVDEITPLLCRFSEYNLLKGPDSLQLSNDLYVYSTLVDKMSVKNTLGTFSASFDPTSSLIYNKYGSSNNTSVPEGWLVPLSYINLGRPINEGDEIARVKIIVPHTKGHSYATAGVYPCLYNITYERGR